MKLKTVGLFLGAAVFVSALTGCVTAPKASLQLWNGENISNWVFVGAEVGLTPDWHAENGILSLPGGIKGYLRTPAAYEDYRLRVEWRYLDKPKNGGVLVHLDDNDKVWPNSVQAQLKKDHVGDIIAMEGFYVKEAENLEKGIVPHGELPPANYESDWVTLEVVCRDDVIDVIVNGAVVNTGSQLERSSGYIGLQLEGVPIAYRKIELTPL